MRNLREHALGGGSFQSIPNSIPLGGFGRGLHEDYFASGIVAGVKLGKQRLGVGARVLGKKRHMRKAGRISFRDGTVSKDANDASLSTCTAHDLL